MKSVFILLVLCISLALSPFIVTYAQDVVTGGGITTESSIEEGSKAKYKVDFYGDLILGPDRYLSSAMMQGKGQYYLASEEILVSSEKVTEISNKAITIHINGEAKIFKLTKTTKICDGSKSLKPNDIKKGDMVTITSKVDLLTSTFKILSELKQQTALSVHKGPMMFGGFPTPVLKKYKCEE